MILNGLENTGSRLSYRTPGVFQLCKGTDISLFTTHPIAIIFDCPGDVSPSPPRVASVLISLSPPIGEGGYPLSVLTSLSPSIGEGSDGYASGVRSTLDFYRNQHSNYLDFYRIRRFNYLDFYRNHHQLFENTQDIATFA